MIKQTTDLSRIERRIRKILELYERARTRGDFLEATLSMHNALEEALNAHLDEQTLEQTFNQKAATVLPRLYGRFNVAELNKQRNFYAHPKQQFSDIQIRNTAVGFVNLVLVAWPDLFGSHTQTPTVVHPPLPSAAPPDPPAATSEVMLSSVPQRIPEPSEEKPAPKTKISWRTLGVGLLLLWPIPWLAGFIQYLWREMPIAWYWSVFLSALLLILVLVSVRSLWLFLRALKLTRFITVLSVGLLVATLILTPFMHQEVGLTGRAGVALTRALNFTRSITVGAASTSFGSGVAYASTLFPSANKTTAQPISPKATPLPATATPGTTRTPTVTPSHVLTIEARVIVTTDGSRLLSRATPGQSAEVVARFENGEELTILDGPDQADGLTWWKVKGQNGSGWSAAQFLTLMNDITNRKVKE